MCHIDTHVVVDHEGTLEASQGSADERFLACLDDPGFGRGVVSVKQHRGLWIGWIWVGLVVVSSCNIVNYKCCILEYVDADKGVVIVIFYVT